MASRWLAFVFSCFFALNIITLQSADSLAAAPKTTSSAKIKTAIKAAAKAPSKKIVNANKKKISQRLAAKRAPTAPQADRFSAVVVDADSGTVLYERNADKQRYPASLTKMMTLYLTFDAMKKGKINLGTMVDVSEKAAGQPQTNINLAAGSRISVENCIKAIVVRSANDAAFALGESLGQTQWNFALMMTNKARELGMRDTVFKNPNGLPDDSQHTSAFDMARLGIALRRDFPDYFAYFKTLRFDYDGITYTTHNRVMLRYDGVDGIKTGFIRASGFNLVTSASKNGHNLVAVIMGGSSATARDDQMIDLLDQSFAELGSKRSHSAANDNDHESSLDKPEQVMSANAQAKNHVF